MTPKEIAKLRRLDEAATKGPWTRSGVRQKLDDEDCLRVGPDGYTIIFLPIGRTHNDHAGAINDAALIVAMRNKLAGMLDAAEENVRLRQVLSSIEVYGSDTLSGPVGNQPDDRKWQRDAVLEMTLRARNGGAAK